MEIILLLIMSLFGAVFSPCFIAGFNFNFLRIAPSSPALAKLQLWFIAVAVQGASWGICSVLCYYSLRKLNLNNASLSQILVQAVLPTLVLTGILTLQMKASNGNSGFAVGKIAGIERVGVPVFVTCGILLAMVSVLGMYLVRLELVTEKPNIEIYLDLLSQANTFMSIAALVLSLGTLGTAVLRAAINAEKSTDYFPAEYVISYGAVFALLLAIAYVPIKASFWITGTAMVQNMAVWPVNAQKESEPIAGLSATEAFLS